VTPVTLTDLGHSIAAIQSRLDAITSDLANMPSWKSGSRWHTDRAAERQRLLHQRESLRNRLAEMALAN
jgi:hypothetical protein